MDICPKVITIRRKKKDDGDIETDRFSIDPTYDSIALIKNIVLNLDEAVSLILLTFHINEKSYCTKYKIHKAGKRVCDIKNLHYAHFYLSLDGHSPDESDYIVAFLPRIMKYSELLKLANELCSIAEWLDIKYINCIVFRYGKPVHGMDDIKHWQKQLNSAIKETKELYLLYKMEGRIKHIPTFLNNKNLTISKNIPLENINVS